MGLRSVLSPSFLSRLDEVIGSFTIVTDDCGYVAEPACVAFCAARDGICATCYAGSHHEQLPVGTVIGKRAVEELTAALRTYEARVAQMDGGTIVLRWPGFLGRPGRPFQDMTSFDLSEGAARLADLLEARSPSNAAILSEVDGEVTFGPERGGKRLVTVRWWYEGSPRDYGKEYRIPTDRPLLVAHGDRVQCGTPLTDGWPDPHDVLQIVGGRPVVHWMLDQARSILGAAAVPLPELPFALVARQMQSRVAIVEGNDSDMAAGELVPATEFEDANQQLIAEGYRPAIARAALVGLSQLT